jgi:hypothetical protein
MKKIFEKLSSFVKNLFGNVFSELKKHSELAVKVTDNIKKLVESPIADVISVIIPGDADDILIAKARVVLPQVVEKVAILHGILKENDTNSDVVANIIENLKQLNPDARISFWVMFAAELNKALSDGKLTLAESFVLTQMSYIELKNNK